MTHRGTGYAQILLTAIFVIGYFWTLHDFIHGNVRVPVEWKETLQSLLTLLTGGMLMILSYWFQRQRQSTERIS